MIEHLDADDEAGYRPGDRVGAYRLVTPIGSGGMGVVWRAERAGVELSQQVAVKLLRSLAAGGAGVRRFRAERQILASLQHPRIAQVLDAGTTARGEPYLVMELVEGRPITDHCRAHRLGLDQRLRLFEQVLEAVAYAHRRLVVHRDLKPSNIWVTGDGQVKLLDFGIAKLLDPGAVALDAAPETRTGLYLLTPEYAAPEQLRGEPVSTATDVWALGVVLSELLTGRRPFELSGKTRGEVERLVCDTDPRRPSRSLPRGGAGVDPDDPVAGGWRRELRGDLDTVVLTALHRRPEERYGSVEELARDLERYRRGLPIGARPATLAYRTRKFVRRHRAAVAAALLVVLSVIFGVASSLRQAALARAQAARAEAISDFLFDMFDGADPELHPGEPITAVELLDAAAEQLDTLDRQPEVRVDVTRILGSLYGKLGQDGRAEALLRRALEQAEAGLGAGDRSRIETLAALGSRLTLAGDPDEAAELLAEALRLEERGAFSPGEQIQTRATLALALQQQGKLEQSEALYRRAVAERERLDGSDAAALGSELHGLANLLLAREQWQEAEAIFRRVAEIRERQLGPEHPGVAVTLWNLAILREQRDDLEAAEALHRRVLEIRRAVYPGGHPQIARSLSQLARMAQKRGAWDQAEELYQDALDHWQQRFGDDHPHRAVILANLATLRYRTGDFAEAAGYQRRAIAIWRVAYGGEDHKLVAAGAHNLGAILLQIGEL
ncbi:MAG: serine/threonine protein kinase, partial [Actinomycetia bacterium]|nr:serine/threonine protein kinase [Actinomycetes bacterium]